MSRCAPSPPAPCRHRPRAGSLCSTSLSLRGYIGGPLGDRRHDISEPGKSRAPQSGSVAPADHQTRLCDSVCPGSKAADAPVLHAEIAVLLTKDGIEPISPADMRSGFVSPYFIVPKKSGGLRPILDQRVLIHAIGLQQST